MIIRNPRELGATIKEQRRKLQMDQRELAAKVGVSRQWLIEVEKGKPGAEVGLIFRTLAALGITLRASDDDVPPGKKPPSGAADIDAIIEKARRPRK